MKNRFGFSRLLSGMMLMDADDGGSGGGGSTPAPRENPADIAAKFSGDAVRMAAKISELEHDNFKHRERVRTVVAENDSLKKQVPAEGALILIGEDAKAWDAYKVFGKPDEVGTAINSGKAAIAERDGFKKSAALEQAAKATGFKPGVLRLLAKDLDVEVRDVEVQKEDGTTEKHPSAFVKQKDSAGVESQKPLRDYFKEQGDDVLSSLEAGESYSNGAGAPLPPQSGTPYPQQSAGGGSPQGYKPANRYAHHIKTE